MEFRDLKKQYAILKKEMDDAILKVTADCNFISGYQVRELEQQLAKYVGVKHCVSCANGTDALSMLLMAWNVKQGDAVFVPDFTFFATGEVVSFEGAKPVFVDVNPDTFNMNPDCLEEAIIKIKEEGILYPKVIIAVDLFGLPADYKALEKIAEKYNLLLLEDGAQGFGGSIGDRKACSFGDGATTSFFPAKPLGCYGDGGAVFTNDDDTSAYLRSIAVHGKGSFKYDNVRIGWNSRLDTIQAAVLQVKLKAFCAYELEDSNKAAKEYTSRLSLLKPPVVPKGFTSSWAQYTITMKNKIEREKLRDALQTAGIPSMIYYPKPMHLQQAFAELGGKKGDFPHTESLCETVLSLPMHPYITVEEIEKVCEVISNFAKTQPI